MRMDEETPTEPAPEPAQPGPDEGGDTETPSAGCGSCGGEGETGGEGEGQ